MSATQPPSQLTAGTTFSYTRTLEDYPASEWTLTYLLRGVSSLTIVATASGDDHLVTITATDSAALASGLYQWSEIVSRGSGLTLEKYLVANGEITVAPDPAAALAGDLQDPVERELALLRTELERRAANGGIERYTIGDSETERRSTKEIEQRVEQLQAQINARGRGGRFQTVRIAVTPRTRLA